MMDNEITDKTNDYLKETYQPEAVTVCGSFADGTANGFSDILLLYFNQSL